jgi:CheY-like chemotaxis protein
MDKVINILLVEDDSLDVMDVKRTMDKMGILHKMQVAKNGEEAFQYLNGVKANNPEAWPDVVLLDINMPKMNGMEFLQAVRNSDQLKNTKIFMLTTSEEKEDKELAKKLGVSGYIVKPLKLNNPSSIDSFNLMIDLLNIKNRI